MSVQNARSSSELEASITIFPPVPGMGCGCSCSCGPSAEDQLKDFLDQLRSLQEHGGHQDDSLFRIEMMQYDSIPAVRSAMMRLNEIFTASGVNYPVTRENLGGILAYYAPIIAINNRIVSTNTFPDPRQLIEQMKVAVS